MSLQPGKPRRRGRLQTSLVQIGIAELESDIHLRARAARRMHVNHFVQRVQCAIQSRRLVRINPLHRLHAADLIHEPAADQREHINRKHRRRVVVRMVLDMRTVIEHRGQAGRNPFQHGTVDQSHRYAGGTQILLCMSVDHRVVAHGDRARQEIRRHIRNHRNADRRRTIRELQPFHGFIGDVMEERRLLRARQLAQHRKVAITVALAVPHGTRAGHRRGLLHGFTAPVTGRHKFRRRLRARREIHRYHRELQAAAALQEHHAVAFGHVQQGAQIQLRFRQNLAEPCGSVTHPKHRHAGLRQCDDRLLGLLQHRLR